MTAAPSGPAEVEAVGRRALRERIDAWRALCGRAREPNAFAAPEFLVPALERLDGAGAVETLFIWEDHSRGRLVGVAALALPRSRFGAARLWQSEQAGLAALCLAHDGVLGALSGLLAWLKPRSALLRLPCLDPGGPTAGALGELARRDGLAMRIANPRRRAALHASAQESFEAQLSKKRAKEWARLRRRLAERGGLAYRAGGGASDVADFLALEAKGWKGRRGTALGAAPNLRAFTGEMVEGFLARGAAEVHRLDLDGKPAAIGVVLRARDRAFFWKTAYEESLAEFSPGVLLTLEMSRALERDARVAMTDSCAIADHPMIDAIWPARIALADFAIATRPGQEARLALAAARAAASIRLREAAKRLLHPLIGAKRS